MNAHEPNIYRPYIHNNEIFDFEDTIDLQYHYGMTPAQEQMDNIKHNYAIDALGQLATNTIDDQNTVLKNISHNKNVFMSTYRYDWKGAFRMMGMTEAELNLMDPNAIGISKEESSNRWKMINSYYNNFLTQIAKLPYHNINRMTSLNQAALSTLSFGGDAVKTNEFTNKPSSSNTIQETGKGSTEENGGKHIRGTKENPETKTLEKPKTGFFASLFSNT